MKTLRLLLAVAVCCALGIGGWFLGCGGEDPVVVCNDADGDGYGDPISFACTFPVRDCDDSNADVNPGAMEGPAGDLTCSDGLDNDCNGDTDEEDANCQEEACVDNDRDGYGDPASEACDFPERDCDDWDPDVNPGATEGPAGDPTCSDGLDNDCNGETDTEDANCQGGPVEVTISGKVLTIEDDPVGVAGATVSVYPAGTPSTTTAGDGSWSLTIPDGDDPVLKIGATATTVETYTPYPLSLLKDYQSDPYQHDVNVVLTADYVGVPAGACLIIGLALEYTDLSYPGAFTELAGVSISTALAPTYFTCLRDDGTAPLPTDVDYPITTTGVLGGWIGVEFAGAAQAYSGTAAGRTFEGGDTVCVANTANVTSLVDTANLPPLVCTDNDLDGYGDPASEACTFPELDCDDSNGNVNPGATEGPTGDATCSDGLDNDCNGDTDEEDANCQGGPAEVTISGKVSTIEDDPVAVAGATVSVYPAGTPSTTTAGDGSWSLTIPDGDDPVLKIGATATTVETYTPYPLTLLKDYQSDPYLNDLNVVLKADYVGVPAGACLIIGVALEYTDLSYPPAFTELAGVSISTALAPTYFTCLRDDQTAPLPTEADYPITTTGVPGGWVGVEFAGALQAYSGTAAGRTFEGGDTVCVANTANVTALYDSANLPPLP